MFNIGFSELIILGVIALLVVGPEQLPDMARKLAKMLNELKRAKDEIMTPFEDMKSEAKVQIEKLRREANLNLNDEVGDIMKKMNVEVNNDEDHIQQVVSKKDDSKE